MRFKEQQNEKKNSRHFLGRTLKVREIQLEVFTCTYQIEN